MNVQVKVLVFPEETKRSFSHNPQAEKWAELSGLEVILLPILSSRECVSVCVCVCVCSFMCVEVMT